MKSKRFDIYDRINDLVVEVIRLTKVFPRSEANKVMVNQLLRSVTSMGANASEADGTSTKRDFVHCFTIVRKEGKESLYWLTLLARTNGGFNSKMSLIIGEGEEILAIVSKIIHNTKKK